MTQEKLHSKKAQIESMVTEKAEFMEGDPKCPNVITASVCDTKTFHYLSMVSE